jgi:hypothetical protein
MERRDDRGLQPARIGNHAAAGTAAPPLRGPPRATRDALFDPPFREAIGSEKKTPPPREHGSRSSGSGVSADLAAACHVHLDSMAR